MKFRVALIQSNGFKKSQANFLKAKNLVVQAKSLRADLVLFPEMWNINYTCFDKKNEEIKSRAIKIDSEEFKEYKNLAINNNLAIVFTYLEKDEKNFYDSAALIDRRGNVLMNYRKTHLADFGWESILNPGRELPVSELIFGKGEVKIGIMICYDREFPEVARILMLNGAEIILVPNACNLENNRLAQFKSRGFENMVGVAMANYPAPKFNGHSIAFDGMRKKGQDYDPKIVEAEEKEGVFIAEFDLKDLRNYRSKEIWGNAYRRPGIYKPLILEEVKKPFIRKKPKR